MSNEMVRPICLTYSAVVSHFLVIVSTNSLFKFFSQTLETIEAWVRNDMLRTAAMNAKLLSELLSFQVCS